MRLRHVLLTVAAAIFFFGPALSLVAGARPRAIENRPLHELSAPRTSWTWLDSTGAALVDHLPARGIAVRARARLSLSVFGEAPPDDATGGTGDASVVGAADSTSGGNSPQDALAAEDPVLAVPSRDVPSPRSGTDSQAPAVAEQPQASYAVPAAAGPAVTPPNSVLVGRGGWLYLYGELYKQCAPAVPFARVASQVAALGKVVRASGRSFVFAVAPDKSTAEPQYLPSSYVDKTCGAVGSQALSRALSMGGIPGYVDMRAVIAQQQRITGRAYYYRKDTHWNKLATSDLAGRIAQSLSPSLLQHSRLTYGTETYTGDLTALLGLPSTDTAPSAAWQRAGVKPSFIGTVHVGSLNVEQLRSRAAGNALYGRPAVVVGDSFSDGVFGSLAPFMSSITRVPDGLVAANPLSTVQAIKSSGAVVVVVNERYIADPSYSYLWSPAFVSLLRTSLSAK